MLDLSDLGLTSRSLSIEVPETPLFLMEEVIYLNTDSLLVTVLLSLDFLSFDSRHSFLTLFIIIRTAMAIKMSGIISLIYGIYPSPMTFTSYSFMKRLIMYVTDISVAIILAAGVISCVTRYFVAI